MISEHRRQGQLDLIVLPPVHNYYRLWGYYRAKKPLALDVCCYIQ
jgi:hypothetical protein